MKEWASADAVNDILDLQLKPCNLANSFKSYLRPPLYHLIHIFINTTVKLLSKLVVPRGSWVRIPDALMTFISIFLICIKH